MSDELISTAIDRTIMLAIVFLALIIAGFLTFLLGYMYVIYSRIKKREKISLEMITLEVKLPKENEIKIDAAEQMLSAFSSLKKSGMFSFMDVDDAIALEVVGRHADIRFYVSAPVRIKDMVEKQIYGYYPQADIRSVDEPNIFTEEGKVAFAALKTKDVAYQPVKVFKELTTDPLASLTSALSKMGEGESGMIQILIRAADSKWKKEGKSYVSGVKKKEATPDKATFKVDSKALEKIDEKTSKPGFETAIRIVVTSPNQESANAHLRNIKAAFNQFSSDLNSFTGVKIPAKTKPKGRKKIPRVIGV